MIVRLLFWLGLLPWILGGSMLVLSLSMAALGEAGHTDLGVGAIGLMVFGFYWTPLCWAPALVYRFLFGRRKTKDA